MLLQGTLLLLLLELLLASFLPHALGLACVLLARALHIPIALHLMRMLLHLPLLLHGLIPCVSLWMKLLVMLLGLHILGRSLPHLQLHVLSLVWLPLHGSGALTRPAPPRACGLIATHEHRLQYLKHRVGCSTACHVWLIRRGWHGNRTRHNTVDKRKLRVASVLRALCRQASSHWHERVGGLSLERMECFTFHRPEKEHPSQSQR
mmetsp:Transcript_28872/g.76169  ORF Transcript_28872/g.76169 Transcript_28872/m.76169 type:complete len:206 (-) Transcript_28872:43-660(-)